MHPSEPDTIFLAPRRPRKGPGKLVREREEAVLALSVVPCSALHISGRPSAPTGALVRGGTHETTDCKP